MKEESKVCTKCLCIKPLGEFGKGNGGDGLKYWCRSCFKDWSKQRTDSVRESNKCNIDAKVCFSCKEKRK